MGAELLLAVNQPVCDWYSGDSRQVISLAFRVDLDRLAALVGQARSAVPNEDGGSKPDLCVASVLPPQFMRFLRRAGRRLTAIGKRFPPTVGVKRVSGPRGSRSPSCHSGKISHTVTATRKELNTMSYRCPIHMVVPSVNIYAVQGLAATEPAFKSGLRASVAEAK
jgi:hypothetical protein